MIDWTNADLKHSGYASLGASDTLNFERVAYAQIPRKGDPSRWVMAFTPIGARLTKADKVRVSKALLSQAGYDLGVEGNVNYVMGRVHTSPELQLWRYPEPAESHRMIADQVNYSHGTGSGTQHKDDIVLV